MYVRLKVCKRKCAREIAFLICMETRTFHRKLLCYTTNIEHFLYNYCTRCTHAQYHTHFSSRRTFSGENSIKWINSNSPRLRLPFHVIYFTSVTNTSTPALNYAYVCMFGGFLYQLYFRFPFTPIKRVSH